jgi:hypothetical protein
MFFNKTVAGQGFQVLCRGTCTKREAQLKATLTFKLPDEEYEFRCASHATKMVKALHAIRNELTYPDEVSFGDKMTDILEEYDIRLEDTRVMNEKIPPLRI